MSSRVLVALRVAASPEHAFDVFTREIHLWWRPQPMFRFTPGELGALAFEPCLDGRFTETAADGAVFEIGRITAWEPGSRLAFTWRQASFSADQVTDVDIRFEAVGAETRVSVEHHGWDSVPQAHVARHGMSNILFLQRHGQWWRELLVSLKGHVG